MKELDITIPKCDYAGIPFTYRINGKCAKFEESDIVYFSVKKRLSDSEYLIQKTLKDGIIFNEDEQKYYITFNYIDTKEMEMGTTYVYDLTIYYEGTKPIQKLFGNLKIGPKVTLNEVS